MEVIGRFGVVDLETRQHGCQSSAVRSSGPSSGAGLFCGFWRSPRQDQGLSSSFQNCLREARDLPIAEPDHENSQHACAEYSFDSLCGAEICYQAAARRRGVTAKRHKSIGEAVPNSPIKDGPQPLAHFADVSHPENILEHDRAAPSGGANFALQIGSQALADFVVDGGRRPIVRRCETVAKSAAKFAIQRSPEALAHFVAEDQPGHIVNHANHDRAAPSGGANFALRIGSQALADFVVGGGRRLIVRCYETVAKSAAACSGCDFRFRQRISDARWSDSVSRAPGRHPMPACRAGSGTPSEILPRSPREVSDGPVSQQRCRPALRNRNTDCIPVHPQRSRRRLRWRPERRWQLITGNRPSQISSHQSRTNNSTANSDSTHHSVLVADRRAGNRLRTASAAATDPRVRHAAESRRSQ